MRTLLIAGNWKLNPTTAEAASALAEGVKNGLGPATDVHVAVAVEIGLGLGERHVDEGAVELGHADLEDRLDRIGLDARRGAEGRSDQAARTDRACLGGGASFPRTARNGGGQYRQRWRDHRRWPAVRNEE